MFAGAKWVKGGREMNGSRQKWKGGGWVYREWLMVLDAGRDKKERQGQVSIACHLWDFVGYACFQGLIL